MGISFLKTAILTLPGVIERPYLVFRTAVEAKKVTVAAADLLWDCSRMNFMPKLPFYEMRSGFAVFRKEILTALFAVL